MGVRNPGFRFAPPEYFITVAFRTPDLGLNKKVSPTDASAEAVPSVTSAEGGTRKAFPTESGTVRLS